MKVSILLSLVFFYSHCLFAGNENGGGMNMLESKTTCSDKLKDYKVLTDGSILLYLVSSTNNTSEINFVEDSLILTVQADFIYEVCVNSDMVYTFEVYGISGEWLPVNLESVE